MTVQGLSRREKKKKVLNNTDEHLHLKVRFKILRTIHNNFSDKPSSNLDHMTTVCFYTFLKMRNIIFQIL